MNIKDAYVHVGPSGTNEKALLKDFAITAALITLTRAILNDAGTGDKTETLNIPIWNQDTTGNAATATKLATAITISLTGSVTGSGSFDGSGNLSIDTTTNHNHDDSYVLKAGDTMTGALTVPSLSVTGSATFSQTIDGSILGNAATASRLQNARTILLTGSVTGSGTFDGSGDLSITTTTNHSHNYVNTIGKSGSTITWSIDGTAQTALDFSTTFAPYNADGYLPLSGGTMTGDITMTSGKSIILTNYTTASSFGSTDRAIPFSITDLPSKIAWTCTDSNLGLTFNPHTGALKSGSFVKRGGTSSQFLKADGSVDSNSYLISSTDVTTATWTAKTDDVNYPIAFSPNETPATSGNGYNTGFTFNPGIKTFNNNGCRLQYDSTNKVLKFIFD